MAVDRITFVRLDALACVVVLVIADCELIVEIVELFCNGRGNSGSVTELFTISPFELSQ